MNRDRLKSEWRSGDPREVVDKHARIIILTPQGQALTGLVETKHGYSVELSIDVLGGKDRGWGYIGADDRWDETWRWSFWPPVFEQTVLTG